MRAVIDDTAFIKQMNNLVAYANGFLEGVQLGKKDMMKNLGAEIKAMLEQYIDANARMDPQALHHVYEWYQVGQPAGRLFEVDYIVTNAGLSMQSTFSQSKSIKDGSKVPFYNKATIMENGSPVTIKPKNSSVLAFDVDGKTVFTSKPVYVSKPGGEVQGQFNETFREFFNVYLSQTFLDVTGLRRHFKTPTSFKNNLAAGVAGGRPVGVRVGRNWVASKEMVA